MAAPDPQRVQWIREALGEAKLDAVVCALPANVLMLSGYCPVVGTSIAVAGADGRVGVLAPEDESDIAREGRADEVRTFQVGSLDCIRSAAEAAREPLAELVRATNLQGARVGYEAGPASQPAPYAALHLYGRALAQLVGDAFGGSQPLAADDVLEGLRGVKTPAEVEHVRLACRVAERAYEAGASRLRPGLGEAEASQFFRGPLAAPPADLVDLDRTRADGFAFCSSGPNSGKAFAAYQRVRGRVMRRGDLVLSHCNSYVGGWWTDVTRTYCLGEPDDRARSAYEAISAARAAALAAIRPGVRARDVDRAAREVMEARKLGKAFKHATGHGVGFAAIDHNSRPRIHPQSDEVLREGMVFNVEPAAYFEGYGGLRHCDMVAVSATGADLFTQFHVDMDALVLHA